VGINMNDITINTLVWNLGEDPNLVDLNEEEWLQQVQEVFDTTISQYNISILCLQKINKRNNGIRLLEYLKTNHNLDAVNDRCGSAVLRKVQEFDSLNLMRPESGAPLSFVSCDLIHKSGKVIRVASYQFIETYRNSKGSFNDFLMNLVLTNAHTPAIGTIFGVNKGEYVEDHEITDALNERGFYPTSTESEESGTYLFLNSFFESTGVTSHPLEIDPSSYTYLINTVQFKCKTDPSVLSEIFNAFSGMFRSSEGKGKEELGSDEELFRLMD
jgi:hypothetical protein